MLPVSVNMIYGRGRGNKTYKNDSALAFEKTAYYDLIKSRPAEPLIKPCKLTVIFTFASKKSFTRRDVDNSMKQVLDALQTNGFIKNDYLIHELSARKVLGKVEGVTGTIEELLPITAVI